MHNKSYALKLIQEKQNGLNNYSYSQIGSLTGYTKTQIYRMHETIDEEANEITLEYQPKENEKIIRFVAISSKDKFPITVDNVKDKYGIISYKTNKLLERI